MKIDRLLSILTLLLQKDKVTAPELAMKFEVSRRTILRDVEDICKAGIPVITWQGGKGGISIAEGFKLDKSLLTVDELSSIVAGLGSISSVTDSPGMDNLTAKLSPRRSSIASIRDSILIDLSSHYKTSLSEKISLIKTAITDSKLICFDYYSAKGMESRVIEPCFITFKWSAWYVFGYCLDKCGFRLFKMNRLWKLKMLEQVFIPREIPAEELELGDFLTEANKVTILFDKATEYLLVDAYGPGSYEETADGMLKFTTGYTNREHMISWILGFGEKAKVLEPVELASEIEGIAKKMFHNYEHDI